MHIVFICREFAPYVEMSSRANEYVQLAKALKQADHEVSVLIPSVQGVDLNAHSLARRLRPQTATVNGAQTSAIRYDGRTADGVWVNLLDIAAPAESSPTRGAESSVECAQAAAFVNGLADPPDLCLLFGWTLSGVAAEIRQYPTLAETVLFSDLRDEMSAEISAETAADRMIVSRRADVPSDKDLASRFAIIPDAAPADPVQDKTSAKTAFQMRVGLPVRGDIPLTLFRDFTVPFLAAYLAADVQAVIADDREDCRGLRERYPDRLAAVSSEDFGAAMHAADGCVVGEDAAAVPAALTCGTLPIVTGALANDVVDIEPSLASGTGIVLRSLSSDDAAAEMSRWISAFHKGAPFAALRARLPEYAVTWNRVVSYIEHLVEEVRTENM